MLTCEFFYEKALYVYTDLDILRSYLALLCSGHANFEHIDLFKDCDFFKKVLELEEGVPSKERLRQRLDIMSVDNFPIIEKLNELNLFLLQKNALPSKVPGHKFIPVDFDVTIFDNSNSHKQGVKPTYQHLSLIHI